MLFGLLAATRHRPVTRLGHTVLVQHPEAFREALTRLPLDRSGSGTTGGVAREVLPGGGVLFDQEGAAHRELRRAVGGGLSGAGAARLRPAWLAVLSQCAGELAAGRDADLTVAACELAGATVCALLGLNADPLIVARHARVVAAAAARQHLPGLSRPGAGQDLATATRQLTDLLAASRPAGQAAETHPAAQADPATRTSPTAQASPAGQAHPATQASPAAQTDPAAQASPATQASPAGQTGELAAISAMLAVAAVNTTVAGLPRAIAWCADAGLWPGDAEQADALAAELLRVIAPTALLPRVAAAAGQVGGHQVRAGDRLILVTRHAALAHLADPDPAGAVPAQVAQLVFGAGAHACPGAALARAQLADALITLAPLRPRVVRAKADRGSALPGWRSLVIRAAARA